MALLVRWVTGKADLAQSLATTKPSERVVLFSGEHLQTQGQVLVYQVAGDPNQVGEEMERALVPLAELYPEEEVYYVVEEHSEPRSMILLVKLIETFPERLQCLYLGQKQGGFDFGEANEQSLVEQLFLSYVESCNYLGIQGLINRRQISASLSSFVQELVRFKEFGFSKGTTKFLQELMARTDTYPQLKIYLPALRELQQLVGYEQQAFIKALFFNCQLEYEQSDFVDFLVRYLRLLEELVMFALGWDDQYGNLVYKAKPSQRVNLPVKELSRLLEAYGKDQRARRKYPKLYQYLTSDKVQKLVRMRHLSVGGHGFGGVSQEVLAGVYPGDIVADLHLVIESLGINIDYNYYDVLNAFLLEAYYALKEQIPCQIKQSSRP